MPSPSLSVPQATILKDHGMKETNRFKKGRYDWRKKGRPELSMKEGTELGVFYPTIEDQLSGGNPEGNVNRVYEWEVNRKVYDS